jgi:UDP-N-acetylglucosamine 2-epimerase
LFKNNVLSVIGTRPQYLKLYSILNSYKNQGIEHEYIDTGQHYSDNMSNVFVTELGLPKPVFNLGVGSDSHANQTAKIMTRLEEKLLAIKPAGIVVYGDTNSTLAAALVGKKIGIKVFHVESGLRSRNDQMPEEINRKVVDHISDRLYAPTKVASLNLTSENLESRSMFSGDITLESILDISRSLNFTKQYASKSFILATLHRGENVDNKDRLQQILSAIGRLNRPVILFGHPRLINSLDLFQLKMPQNIEMRSAVSFTELLIALNSSEHVITDSGGLQKEAYILGKPCITLRSETEWVETIDSNWNILCNDLGNLGQHLERKIIATNDLSIFGDGNSADLITNDIQAQV